MPKSPKSQVPNTLRQKLGKGLWLPVFVAVGFIAFNRILANKDTFFRTPFAELYEERSKIDEEASRQYKEMQIERIKKQVIEEKLKEKRD